MLTLPSSIAFRPRMARASVVLPLPLSPTSARVSPGCSAKLTPSTANSRWRRRRASSPLPTGKDTVSSSTPSSGGVAAATGSLLAGTGRLAAISVRV